MKLQELKRKLGKKYSIRIVAGILVVALAGTPAAGVLAATAEDAVLTEVEKYKDTEKETGKEETVYVILDSTGKEKEVIVSDHLINRDGKEVIEDASTLKDIENVKGEETYSRSGDGITWKADGAIFSTAAHPDRSYRYRRRLPIIWTERKLHRRSLPENQVR